VILALAGGVGGAKLAAGLARALSPGELTVVVNTGDDFDHLGLHVSPDLDTVMYTLAGVANPQAGWGREGETWNFMQSLATLGGPTWFQLGDKDLATHIERTRCLRSGESLTSVTRALCGRLGVRHAVLPMSDDPVRTVVHTEKGELDFQHYFVRERCKPRVSRIEYHKASAARPSPQFAAALADPALEGIVICPSNPYLSIAPILAIPGVRDVVARCPRVLAVSPIIAGKAVKGPAAKLMQELGAQPGALEIARWYRGIVRTLVIDRSDAALAPQIEALGIVAAVEDALMRDDAGRERLARACLARLVR